MGECSKTLLSTNLCGGCGYPKISPYLKLETHFLPIILLVFWCFGGSGDSYTGPAGNLARQLSSCLEKMARQAARSAALWLRCLGIGMNKERFPSDEG